MATVVRKFEALQDDPFLDAGSAAQADDVGVDSEFITLATYEGAHCHVEADFPSTATNDLVIEVLATNDGDNFDNIPLFSFTVDNATDGHVSFVVTSVFGFKVRFKSSGTAHTIGVFFRYRRWQWETV
jgi:hypothetical protein